MKPSRICLAVAICLPGCALDDFEELETGESQHGIAIVERLASNRLASNRLASNRLASNRLASNRLASNALAPGGLSNQDFRWEMSDEATREFVKFAVECALRPNQSVTFMNSYWQAFTYHGLLGFAPEWQSGECDTRCQQLISGCLSARANYLGRREALSLRMLGDQVSSTEALDHSVREGAFYGNLFTTDGELFWCNDLTDHRFCDQGLGGTPECGGVQFAGPCNDQGHSGQQACGAEDSNGNFLYCATGDLFDNNNPPPPGGGDVGGGSIFTWAITSYRPGPVTWECGYADYETHGPDWSPACSLCSRQVIREGGTSHRTGGSESARSTCATNWTSACVDSSRDLCGEHSVCEIGSAMYNGDSACVDDICEIDSYCCEHSWDASCVEMAETVCGHDCSPYEQHSANVWSYCSAEYPCSDGEGDCDPGADDCVTGTACTDNVGADYGYSSSVNVCVDCHNDSPGGYGYCSAGCPCRAGEGDCDTNSDCAPGLVCRQRPGVDYCVHP